MTIIQTPPCSHLFFRSDCLHLTSVNSVPRISWYGFITLMWLSWFGCILSFLLIFFLHFHLSSLFLKSRYFRDSFATRGQRNKFSSSSISSYRVIVATETFSLKLNSKMSLSGFLDPSDPGSAGFKWDETSTNHSLFLICSLTIQSLCHDSQSNYSPTVFTSRPCPPGFAALSLNPDSKHSRSGSGILPSNNAEVRTFVSPGGRSVPGRGRSRFCPSSVALLGHKVRRILVIHCVTVEPVTRIWSDGSRCDLLKGWSISIDGSSSIVGSVLFNVPRRMNCNNFWLSIEHHGTPCVVLVSHRWNIVRIKCQNRLMHKCTTASDNEIFLILIQ